MCVSDENFGQYHARDFNCPWRDAARDLRLVRDFLSFSNNKNYFYKFRYVPKYMRKIVDLCFYFLLKKKLGKSTFFFGYG